MLDLRTSLPKHILVVRSLPGLGDLLCGVPALRALRAAFPASRISFMGLPGQRWFGDRFIHLIDAWVDFSGYPGIPEGWQGAEVIPPFLIEQQGQAYDLALQMHGSGSYINSFISLLGAKVQAGFFVPGQYCPDPHHFLAYPDKEPEIWRLLRLLEYLQIPLQGDRLEFPIQSSDLCAYLHQAKLSNLQPQSYVCIHPGASGGDRRWSPTGFAAVADTLAQKGYTVVLTGTAAEQALVETVAQKMASRPVSLAGKTSLGTLAVLLQRSALLVCNDTGISHLAAATNTPSVVVFSNSEVHRWAPLDGDRHHTVDARQLQSATLEKVLAEVEALLFRQSDQSVQREVAHAG
ncbi:MAG: glycosyltransferase family 9 protein [Synechococcales bacterium]|nr:glycosyltransferase family 9 protein [Synechococcales bacterium]